MSTPGRAIAIVRARLGTGRLPGKVLLPLAGRPVILHVVDRLRRVVGLDGIVVATTTAPEDARLVEFLESESVPVFAHPGDVNDLLGRYLAAGTAHDADIALLVDGDCPLLHPDTSTRMIAQLRNEPDAEYVKIVPRTIEAGVACLRMTTCARMVSDGAVGAFREHATLQILQHPERFRITTIDADPAFATSDLSHRFWLDTDADYRFLSALYQRLYRPGDIVDLHDVLRLLGSEPALRRTPPPRR